LNEARKVLVDEIGATLVTIAKDVKIQVEFNPAKVAAYRLIGYENRILQAQDFNDDTKDAGEIGAGHTVTALFEVVPAGVAFEQPDVDPLRYQAPRPGRAADGASRRSSNELLNVKIRYKAPDSDTSTPFEVPLVDRGAAFESASDDFRFAAAVAEFGMILRDSPHKGSATFDSVRRIADRARGGDASGYRSEFIELVVRARALRD
jgi:Ca-activated chloride channel family protein